METACHRRKKNALSVDPTHPSGVLEHCGWLPAQGGHADGIPAPSDWIGNRIVDARAVRRKRQPKLEPRIPGELHRFAVGKQLDIHLPKGHERGWIASDER